MRIWNLISVVWGNCGDGRSPSGTRLPRTKSGEPMTYCSFLTLNQTHLRSQRMSQKWRGRGITTICCIIRWDRTMPQITQVYTQVHVNQASARSPSICIRKCKGNHYSIVLISSETANLASVLLRTSSTVTPGASSVKVNPPF